jgi:DNA helicase II / ATP-dependent DNA helicase PcrA
VVLADIDLDRDHWVVYLMHRVDRGWRVGLTKSVRPVVAGIEDLGVRVRLNQERADDLWILRVCESRADAAYWEAWFAAEYGLPTALFHGDGRRLAMDDRHLERLYLELDTDSRAKHLMEDHHLHPDMPHLRTSGGSRRQTLNLTMFSTERGGGAIAHHRVQWSSNRSEVAELLRGAGLNVRPGKGPNQRYETTRKSYREALDLARRAAAAGGLAINHRAQVGDRVWRFVPLAHLWPGMHVIVEREGCLQPARVESVDVDHYEGPVYDLEVDRAHTYVADGVLVHNSIYRFRGADIRNILEFETAFPDATVLVLEQNYRSSQTILDAANAVIAKNLGRKPKELWTDRGDGHPIIHFHASDEVEEAQWVARELGRLHDENEIRWSDAAVFYRTNAMSRVVEEHLTRVGIPYKVIGGTRFYDRREVKDALSYLRAVVNPVDEVSVKRVLNVPKRGVGDSSVGKLDAHASAHGMAFIDALRRADDAGVGGKAAKGIAAFLDLLDGVTDLVADDKPGPLLQALLDRSGYVAELEAERSIESEGRLENVAELVGSAHEAESIEQFLEQVSLVSDVDELDGDASQVVLMTVHSAKGLEFPTVFIVGLEDGVFPHFRSLGEPDELEEERRLAYVAVTRAQDRLYLSHADTRTLYGRTDYQTPSRFLDEIPEGLVTGVGQGRRSRGGRSYGSGGSWGGGSSDAGRSRVDINRDRMVERALRPSAPAPSGAESLGLKIGDDVRHGKYGEGVILDIRGQGDKAEAVVRFPEVGEKLFLLSWTPLEKI